MALDIKQNQMIFNNFEVFEVEEREQVGRKMAPRASGSSLSAIEEQLDNVHQTATLVQ